MSAISPTTSASSLIGRLIMAGAAAAAVTVLIVQLRSANLAAAFADVRVGWLLGAVVAAGVSIVAAVHNLSAFAPIRLRFADSVRAQLAVCGIRIVTPSAVSTPAVCARYLNRSGLGTAESLAVVGVAQAAQLLMTTIVVAGLAVAGSGRLSAPNPVVVAIVVGAISAALGAAVLLARRSPRIREPLLAAGRATKQVASHLRRHPLTGARGLVASVALTVSHVAAFACCVAAVGGHVSLLTATAVYLAASSAGSLVPTPGGVGAVEAAMIAGLATAGMSVVSATAAALLVRIVMTWALVPPGLMALRSLRRRGLL